MRRIRGGRKEVEEDEGSWRKRMGGAEIEEEEEVQGVEGLHSMYCSRQESRKETHVCKYKHSGHTSTNRPNTVYVLRASRFYDLSDLILCLGNDTSFPTIFSKNLIIYCNYCYNKNNYLQQMKSL